MTLRKELTFEGGVNIEMDPHLLSSNEWQLLKNLWPYKSKLLGSRPSLLHEQDILPVPNDKWNGYLFQNNDPDGVYPTAVSHYANWFRHLTPLRAVFMGDLSKVALVCVCNVDGLVELKEHFEGAAETIVTLSAGDVILMLTPNDIQTGVGVYPTISGVRLGKYENTTPSLIVFNGTLIAANKNCTYVVSVVKSSSLALPSATVWPGIDYRFTKVDFGPTNADFRTDGVIVYKNRFVYWRGNRVWFSDPFQPGVIYDNATDSAYLGVFFDTALTEEITAMTDLYTSALEEAGKSVLAIWTQHSMLLIQGEPATTIASTAEELFANCSVTRVSVKAGCVSQASIVKTKFGIIWCGAKTVWFMAKGNLPIEVGSKIMPRISDQSFESAGRIFATFDDECYRLVINSPGVGFNPYEALNEMWCLSFINQEPSKESAAWFGPQVFTNTDNPVVNAVPESGGTAGLFCCAQLTNVNDDKTWYIQPYSYDMNSDSDQADGWGTRLGLACIDTYLGCDITAPFRMEQTLDDIYEYSLGAIIQLSRGTLGYETSYAIEFLVTRAGSVLAGTLAYEAIYINELNTPLNCKRALYTWMEGTNQLPDIHGVGVQSGNLVFDNPELVKLVNAYELTFKTLNPVLLSSFWWPWQPNNDEDNLVILASKAKVPIESQNVLDRLFNEPVLTARRVPTPKGKRYNGLTAQLNITDPGYRIVSSKITDPNWNKIKISPDNIRWATFDLFDYNTDGIAEYQYITLLTNTLIDKVLTNIGKSIDVSDNPYGANIKFTDNTPLYIDTTGQGWEWFGFIPTGYNNGYGVNIITNQDNPTRGIYSIGPVPVCTPHAIHMAKLSVLYRVLGARPR